MALAGIFRFSPASLTGFSARCCLAFPAYLYSVPGVSMVACVLPGVFTGSVPGVSLVAFLACLF